MSFHTRAGGRSCFIHWGYTTHSCQISTESNLPFVRYYVRIELRRLTGICRLRVGFRASSAVSKQLVRST